MVELSITEGDGGIIDFGKKEDLYTTMSLIPYAEDILEQKDINYALQQI